jgi:hypothetical protein
MWIREHLFQVSDMHVGQNFVLYCSISPIIEPYSGLNLVHDSDKSIREIGSLQEPAKEMQSAQEQAKLKGKSMGIPPPTSRSSDRCLRAGSPPF